jgi:hypothetical protein
VSLDYLQLGEFMSAQQSQEEHEQAVEHALQECLSKDISSESMAILMYECGKSQTQFNYLKEKKHARI